MASSNNGGPWGGGSGGDDNGDGASGGDDSGTGSTGPRNPWTQPPSGDRGSRGRGNGPTSIDDLWRRGRGSFGGGSGGGGNGPSFAGGRSILPLVLIGFLALWLIFTSFHRIDSNEEGVVSRFGKYSRNVGPGVQFTLPAPIETLQKVDTKGVRTLDIGSTDPTVENLVLTGDQNIIDLAYAVRWNVKQPQLYLFQLSEPDQTIREVAESSMRATIANFTLTQAIGPARSEIEQQVKERMQTLLDQYRSGVSIDGIAIRQSDPPAAVNEAFKRVTVAQQNREGYLNKAGAYARQITEQATGEATAFDKVYEQYRLAPEVTRRRMYYETMERVLGKVDKTIVETSGVQTYLPLPEVRRRSATPPPAEAAPAPAPAPEAAAKGAQ